jgi:ABC-type branched-subunit amino acid transport system ATPase component
MLNNKVLKVERLFASYFKREILHGVSLEIKEKEIVSLIGPNGAGKSTLLKAIFGIIQTKKGKIVFNGKDITNSTPRENVKDGIGYLLQGGEIFSNLTVEDNLILSIQNKEVSERKDFVYSLFPKLASLRKKRAGLLSGGERQMLAIGITLMSKPKLLLLDEPTASLSQDMADIISEGILKIRKESDTSILLVEQNIDRSLKISDRIYLMRQGEIIDQGSSVEMTESQKVEKLFYLI